MQQQHFERNKKKLSHLIQYEKITNKMLSFLLYFVLLFFLLLGIWTGHPH